MLSNKVGLQKHRGNYERTHVSSSEFRTNHNMKIPNLT